MKSDLIAELFQKFEEICYLHEGVECWSARELQRLLGYTKWDNFLNVIQKARSACENAGAATFDHFADIGKMVGLGSKSERKIEVSLLPDTPAILLLRMGMHRSRLSHLPRLISQYKHESRK